MGDLEISKVEPVKDQRMLRGDEKEDDIRDKIDWEAVNEYIVENENGSKLSFKEVYHDVTTIVIFIRVSIQLLLML